MLSQWRGQKWRVQKWRDDGPYLWMLKTAIRSHAELLQGILTLIEMPTKSHMFSGSKPVFISFSKTLSACISIYFITKHFKTQYKAHHQKFYVFHLVLKDCPEKKISALGKYWTTSLYWCSFKILCCSVLCYIFKTKTPELLWLESFDFVAMFNKFLKDWRVLSWPVSNPSTGFWGNLLTTKKTNKLTRVQTKPARWR